MATNTAIQTQAKFEDPSKLVGVNLNYLIPGLPVFCDIFVYRDGAFELFLSEKSEISMSQFIQLKNLYFASGFIRATDQAKWSQAKIGRLSVTSGAAKTVNHSKTLSHPGRPQAIQTFFDHATSSIKWVESVTSDELEVEKRAKSQFKSSCAGETLAWFFGEAKPDEPIFFHNARVAYLSALFTLRYLPVIPQELLSTLITGAIAHELRGDPAAPSSQSRGEETLRFIDKKEYIVTESIRTLINQQEEFYDGSGRPNQKKGGEISILARILALTDQWDHFWIQNTGGTRKIRKDRAIEAFKKRASQFDPKLYRLFMDFISRVDVNL